MHAERWRPDQRSVGAALVALFLAGFLVNLVTVDVTVANFTHAVQVWVPQTAAIGNREVAVTGARLVVVPSQLLVVIGAPMLTMRRRGGRGLTLLGLGTLVIAQFTEAVVLLTSEGASVYFRIALSEVLPLVGSALALAVVLWSRPAPDAG
jgi:hypothetical protein